MIHASAEEKQAATFLKATAIVHALVGVFCLVTPSTVLWALNELSQQLLPTSPVMPVQGHCLFSVLAFSLMMSVAAQSGVAQRNVRKYRPLIALLILSKAASSLAAFLSFAFHERYAGALVIGLFDAGLLGLTVFLCVRANKAFLKAQTFFLHKPAASVQTTPPTRVVVRKGEDKVALLDQVLGEAGFWDVLDRRFALSGKAKADFRVVIKPNFMFMHAKKDISSYTDPGLVEALVDRIVARGFTHVTLVESQSTYGNYYTNREVVKVAEYIGYSRSKNYRIVDLTEEMVPFDYSGRLGRHMVGPTWRDADFRVSFAKNKTHMFCHYTLTLKNIYGTLPLQNKLREYHGKREYDWPTIETLKHFPVHFGLIDAIWSADGQFGVIVDAKPNPTKTILGGENLIAVDWVGAKKMGLDPDAPHVGRYLPLAIEAFGRPERIDWIGDQSRYEPWTNVSEALIRSLDVLEEAQVFTDWLFSFLSAQDAYFKYKLRAWPALVLRKLLAPLKRLLFRFDDLSR